MPIDCDRQPEAVPVVGTVKQMHMISFTTQTDLTMGDINELEKLKETVSPTLFFHPRLGLKLKTREYDFTLVCQLLRY